MKSVVICCSQRFNDEITRFAARLKSLGASVVLLPNFSGQTSEFLTLQERERLTSQNYRGQVATLVLQHFDRIRRADVCFVYNKGGYLGVNTTLELGFAHALNKIIYALEPENTAEFGGELCREILYTDIIHTPEELYEKLK